MATDLILAHGVGRVYESPLPLALYLAAAGGTVAVSFVLRALVATTTPLGPERRVLGEDGALVTTRLLRAAALLGLALTIVSGVLTTEGGLSLPSLLFWIGLVVGTTCVSALLAGAWPAADPWATIERSYRTGPPARERVAPWWVGPLGIYLLFWFELVSGVGFDPFWVVAVLLGYSLAVLGLRPSYGGGWALIDPLHILFSFAARCAPFRLAEDGIYYKGPLRDLDRDEPMPRALYGAVFVLLASTTLDNVRETVGWTSLKTGLGLENAPGMLVDSVALLLFALLFLAPFLAAVWISKRVMATGLDFGVTARRFAWSLVPIGIAYVLAHNAPLIMTGAPFILRGLSDPLGRGWNLFGTATVLETFFPSPAFVWALEIILIVGGHILGVLAAHRCAVRLGDSHRAAVRSQWALTVLMSVFTITTLWLLSQPLVA